MGNNNFKGTEHQELYNRLKEAYTEENLNGITSKIVDLYKSKQFEYIKDLVKIIENNESSDSEKINKSFSKLIMLYHPDKLNYYERAIEKAFQSGITENLYEYSHIFAALDMEEVVIADRVNSFECEFCPEYEWDYNEKGFNYYSEEDVDNLIYEEEFFEANLEDELYRNEYKNYNNLIDNSFYSAVKRKIYGNREIDLPSYLLEDIEEIEMAEYEIDNLEGIECCKHVTNLDLSNNNITNITELNSLKRLEELYLTNNQIGFIDALISLKKLKVIDISNNDIDDLTPILNLPELEYLNVFGNKIPQYQIEILESKGVFIVN